MQSQTNENECHFDFFNKGFQFNMASGKQPPFIFSTKRPGMRRGQEGSRLVDRGMGVGVWVGVSAWKNGRMLWRE